MQQIRNSVLSVLVAKEDKVLRKEFPTSNFVQKIKTGVMLRLLANVYYKEVLSGLQSDLNIKQLISFSIRNNLILASLSPSRSPIKTKEDYKMELLHKLHHGEITVKKFKEVFGNYSLDPFNVKVKRFKAFSKDELLNIAKFCKDYRQIKTITLADYLNQDNKNLAHIYQALREEIKYKLVERVANEI